MFKLQFPHVPQIPPARQSTKILPSFSKQLLEGKAVGRQERGGNNIFFKNPCKVEGSMPTINSRSVFGSVYLFFPPPSLRFHSSET